MDARTKFYIESVERRSKELPVVNKSATLALYHLLGTADLLHGHFTPFATRLGLSLAGWGVLNLLFYAEGGARPMHELSELLLVSRQNVSQLVDGLEKKRFVERTPCPADGRVKLVAITRKGRDVVLAARDEHHRAIRAVFETLRDPELDLLSDYLLRVQGRIEEIEAQRSPAASLGGGPEAKPARGSRPGRKKGLHATS
jgi:MarR family 2-MHQ and catechol resistance regulon transcriptional repressor